MKAYLTALFLLACLGVVSCGAAPPQSTPLPDATEVLRSTSSGTPDIFAQGPTGPRRQRTAKRNAYEAILLRPDAPQIFLSLLDNPSVVTQMYALAGLRLTAPRVFERAFPRFEKRHDKVHYASSGSGDKEVGELAREFRALAHDAGESLFPSLSPAGQEAIALPFLQYPLGRRYVFSLGPTGRGSYLTPEYLAFKAINRRQDALVVFRSLLSSSSNVTQMYGLTGLARIDSDTFKHLAPSYVGRNDALLVQAGCITSQRPLGDCVRDLLAGRSPDNPYRSLKRRQPNSKKRVTSQ